MTKQAANPPNARTRRWGPVVTVILLSFSGLACGPGPIDNSSWTLEEAAQAALMHEHPFVAPDDPSRERHRVELVPEWTAGEHDQASAGSTDAGIIYRARRATIDRLGRTWVMDFGDSRLKVFDFAGEFVTSMGAEGQGPEEFGSLAVVVSSAGDQVVVSDDSNSRLSFWSLDGEHVRNTRINAGGGPVRGYPELYGLGDGTLVGAFTEREELEGARGAGISWVFERLGPAGEVLGRYPTAPTFLAYGNVNGRRRMLPTVSAVPRIAVATRGDVYMTAADKYQVLALATEGSVRWALRVDWPNAPYPDGESDRAIEALESMGRAMGEGISLDRSSIVLPTHAPAVSQLRVDDAGRLYVFPWVRRWAGPRDNLDEWRPVDVYSRAGQLLFNGQMKARFAIHDDQSPAWMGVHEGSVRGLATNPDTNEIRLVSYRLKLPLTRQ